MNLDYLLKAKADEMKIENKKDYFYAATRARAMIARLLSDADYEKLTKMDINELLRFLGEGDYKKEIDAVGIKAAKIESLEIVLNENFANSVKSVLKFMPPGCPLWPYIMKYDIANIKAIIRNKETAGRKEDLLRVVVPAGSIGKEKLHSLVNLEKKASIIEALAGTPYYRILKKNENEGLEKIEDALEKFYFSAMLKIAAPHKQFYNLVRMEIDARNVLTIIRLKRAKIHEGVENFLIKGGGIPAKKLHELSRLDEFEIINSLKSRNFWKYAPTNTKELDKIEVGLRKYLFIYSLTLQREFNSFEPLLGYILGKEREIANIRMLARSKTVKNPEDSLNIRSKLYVKQS